MLSVASIKSRNIEDYSPFLQELSCGGLHENLVKEWLGIFASGQALPFSETLGDENTILVFQDEFVRVTFRCLNGPDGSSNFSVPAPHAFVAPNDSMLLVVSGAPLAVDRRKVIGKVDANSVRRRVPLTDSERSVCQPGDTFRVRRSTDLIDVTVLGAISLVWQVTMVECDPLVLAIGRDSCVVDYATSASPEATRDQMICRGIAEMDSAECLPALLFAAEVSEFHFVRMEAIKAVGMIDGNKGMALLRRASVSDQHAHVRAACLATLATIQANMERQ